MKKILFQNKGFFALLLFLIFWSVFLYHISPVELINYIGFGGVYFILFFTALIGVSGFASAPFFAFLSAVAYTGDFNPIVLGLVAGPARVLGDVLFYYLGLKGGEVFSGFGAKYLNRFSNWLNSQPKWLVPVIAFFYSGFSPLPQDVIMVPLGVGKVKLKFVLIPVLLGNILFVSLFSYFIAGGM